MKQMLFFPKVLLALSQPLLNSNDMELRHLCSAPVGQLEEAEMFWMEFLLPVGLQLHRRHQTGLKCVWSNVDFFFCTRNVSLFENISSENICFLPLIYGCSSKMPLFPVSGVGGLRLRPGLSFTSVIKAMFHTYCYTIYSMKPQILTGVPFCYRWELN